MSEIIISEQHKQAVELHQKILVSANLAQQNLWDMCTSLKQMRDGKLYKELGYNNFEDYCETEVGMKRRNAYNYISVIEKVDVENVQSIAQIGMTKLSLLATISHEEQAEISEKVNLEETTVKDLKAEIDKLKNQNKQLSDKSADYCKQMMSAKQAQQQAEEQADSLQQLINSNRSKLDSLKAENKQLTDEVEELRNRPIEVQVVDNSDSERRLKETIQSLERENIKRNEELERQYREDEQAVRRMLEKDKQNAIDQLTAEYEEKLKALQQAQPQQDTDDKEVFKAYFKTAYDSFNRMVEFAEASTNKDIYKSKIGNLINAFIERKAEI
ncbi:MAG: hypothetical protein UD936_08045 [Acutalibacteraceae bacterium]|nr:hypothetical protein [Acutalibacteraceae bacterium]